VDEEKKEEVVGEIAGERTALLLDRGGGKKGAKMGRQMAECRLNDVSDNTEPPGGGGKEEIFTC